MKIRKVNMSRRHPRPHRDADGRMQTHLITVDQVRVVAVDELLALMDSNSDIPCKSLAESIRKGDYS